jgi:hypothetical protein
MDQNEIPQDPRDLGVRSDASKTISKAVVCSAETVHQFCIKISTIFERTESSFHLSLINQECHRVRPKWFLCLWYVRRKPCNYLASRITLYQMNWVKHPLELRHLGVISGASKTISEPTVCLAQTYTYLAPTPTLSQNGPKRDFIWPTPPWNSIGCVQNDLWGCGTFGTNRAPILRQD